MLEGNRSGARKIPALRSQFATLEMLLAARTQQGTQACMNPKEQPIVPRIFAVRGESVMLESDLAALYGVETKQFNRAIQRNAQRFPADFALQLAREELANLKCQFGTSSGKRIHVFARAVLRALEGARLTPEFRGSIMKSMVKLPTWLKKIAEKDRRIRRNQRPMTSAEARQQCERVARLSGSVKQSTTR